MGTIAMLPALQALQPACVKLVHVNVLQRHRNHPRSFLEVFVIRTGEYCSFSYSTGYRPNLSSSSEHIMSSSLDIMCSRCSITLRTMSTFMATYGGTGTRLLGIRCCHQDCSLSRLKDSSELATSGIVNNRRLLVSQALAIADVVADAL